MLAASLESDCRGSWLFNSESEDCAKRVSLNTFIGAKHATEPPIGK